MLSSYLLLGITLLVGIFQIEKLFPESFKAKPWIILGLLVALTIFSFVVEHNKDKEAKAAFIAAQIKESERDTAAEIKRKESNLFILNGIGDAIGKYKLGYDSVTKEFYKLQKLIKDSANRKTTVIQGDNPNIDFTANKGIFIDSLTDNYINVHVSLTSNSAPSILKEASLYILYSENQKENVLKDLRYDTKVPFLSKNLGFSKDSYWEGGLNVRDNNIKRFKTIVILVIGTYTDSYGKNPQILDKIGSFDLVSKQFGMVVQPYDDSVRIFLRRKGVIK